MQILDRKSLSAAMRGILSLSILLSLAVIAPEFAAAQISAKEIVLALDPAQTKVHWKVDSTLHTVHGTFALKSGVVHFDPNTGEVGGEIVVLTTTGESGNNSRDRRMHREILETAKYPEAVFRPEKIDGKVARTGVSDIELEGIISLHGSEHETAVAVHLELEGKHWQGTAKFDIPYIQWGIKDPSHWMLKVNPVVNVDLAMTGSESASN
jgi:polyisoprenoid-binding protein YceI